MLVIKAQIYKMHVRIANREDLDQGWGGGRGGGGADRNADDCVNAK